MLNVAGVQIIFILNLKNRHIQCCFRFSENFCVKEVFSFSSLIYKHSSKLPGKIFIFIAKLYYTFNLLT